MMTNQRDLVVQIISSEIRSHSFVRMNQLTKLLEKHRINRNIYDGKGPKRWIESNFPEFKVEGNHGKEIIIFSTDVNSINVNSSGSELPVVEEERLNYSALCSSADNVSTESSYRVGVVNFCNYKNAFINQWHGKTRPDDEGLAVIFDPTRAQTFPEKTILDTKTFVYLVCYATSGTVRNTKTGIDHPAFDYSAPIKIIRALPKAQCAYIRISSEEVIIGHIIATKQNMPDSPVNSIAGTEKTTIPEESLAVLDVLFESSRYVDFLASDTMKRIQPHELPLKYLEKALTCAHRLIYPDSVENICLNLFQQELISNPTTLAFIKKWKTNGIFSEDIVMQCGETALAHYDYPEHVSHIAKLLNAIGSERTQNNNYVGITARFVACENVLIPHFYIIRAFVQDSAASIQRIVSEYCQLVKDLKHSASVVGISDNIRMCSIENVLRIIHNHIFDCSQLTPNLRTNIVSAFFEYEKLHVLQSIIPFWDPARISTEWRLTDLYFHYSEWTEQRFKQLIDDGVNRQLMQRCLALLWREAYCDNILNKTYLNLLSWVLLYDHHSSIEEIVRYPSGKDLSRIAKRNMLINSFETVCDYTVDNEKMYVLASYIIFIVQEYISRENASIDAKELIDRWNKLSSNFYSGKAQYLSNITSETERQLVDLFAIFHMDFPNYLKLQTYYAEWFVRTYPPALHSVEEFDAILEELYNKGAYAAFVEYYSFDSQLELKETRRNYTSQYIESLMNLHRYTDAISFLRTSQSLDISEKNTLLVRAIGENFRENGISPKAFSCIGDASMCNEAIKTLLGEFKYDYPLIINSLIALYIYEKKYIHAAYLLTIFGSKADKGFVRLYRQVRSQLGRYADFNKLKSQHHVIEYAFQTLNADALIDFLKWASRITIPKYRERKENHVFSFYYDNIVANVTSETPWVSFLRHLVKYGIERNASTICVCETILRKELNYQDSYYSREALEKILSSNNTELFAPNVLTYAFEIIRDRQSAPLCQQLVDVLSNKSLYQHIITDNVWLNSYEESIKAFKHFCQDAYETTGHPVFHEILPLLGTDLSIYELKTLAHSATGKQALFSKICNNYLNDRDALETTEILFSEDWSGLTENEYALLTILRMVYADDDVLLLDPDNLFRDEFSVRCFKRDCVEIISAYPEKTGLFAFDKQCNNESYKMLVYSFVFEVLYDQKIYEPLTENKGFSVFSDHQTYKVYLRLLWCAYRAQSRQNITFPFFYKKWRYLKLYLLLVLQCPTEVNDADILTLMENNGHYDTVFANSYAPFVETVKQFMELEDLSQEFKNHFLFAVMVSYIEDLYDNYAQMLASLPLRHKTICRKLIAFLDFRYFNTGLFRYLWDDIKVGEFSIAIPLGETISDYAYDTLVALKDNYCSSTMSMFEKLAFMEKGSQVLNSIVTMDIAELSEHHHWIVPMLCSRQLDFYINDRFRLLVIAQKDHLVCEKYKYISDYFVCKGKSTGIYTHLCALLACMKSNAEQAKHIIGDGYFCYLVPHDWSDEAKRIIEYANGAIQAFKPARVRVDGSRVNIDKNVKFEFPSRLLKSIFGEENIPTNVQAAAASYAGYRKAADPWAQAKLGLEALLWRASPQNSQTKIDIPTANSLGLEVGLDLLRPEVGLTVENRLAIIKELYDNRSGFTDEKDIARIETLMSKFTAIIDNGFPLTLWVAYDKTIEEFLRETNALVDFAELKERILNECRKIASPDVGYDEKRDVYDSLLKNFSGLTSSYAINVKRAISDEIDRLANDIQLTIEIENPETSEDCRETTDNCVYFRIKNNGKRTVSFSPENLEVKLQQEKQPETPISIKHITELQSDSMTGGKAPLIVTSETKIPVKLLIVRTTPSALKEVVCSTEATMSIIAPCPPCVPAEAVTEAQKGVSSAVTDEQLLFGRDDKKELLTKRIPSGVTLIYGPSRIGKTSLMNWIRKKHAIDQGNVLSVLIGGENGMGKDTDYAHQATDQTKQVPYDDPYQMSRYLLVDTLAFALNKRNRLGYPEKVMMPDSLVSDMLRILRDDVTSIDWKYFKIDELLKTAGVELWLLFDEFQQVVERWKNPPNWCEFFEICNLLSSTEVDNKPNNIKIIFCGSDDLLSHMILKRDSVWQKTFRSTVPVNALEESGFKQMIEHDRAISMTNLSFSPSAVKTLFNYTGGIALYGKEICRSIFEDIPKNKSEWESRNVIYSSDIAEATHRLLRQQEHDLSIQAQEGISAIYTAVKKNLDGRTEMQLLWYMATWLYRNPQEDGFPENYFAEHDLTPEFGEHLHDSFAIAEARGIIWKRTSQNSDETVYTFSTLFYYFAFYGSAIQGNLDESLIFASKDSISAMSDVSTSDPLSALEEAFEQVPQEKREKAFHMLYGGLTKDEKKSFRIGFGEYSETNIDTQNNIHVNIQSMSNTFATLLSGDVSSDKYLAAFGKLPSVKTFIPQENKKLLGERITALHEADDEKTLREAEHKVEELTFPAEQEMTGTYIAAAINSTDFFKVSDERWKALIHVNKEELERCLPPEFITSLGFAVMLHNVFEAIRLKASTDDVAREKADTELDYCPVAIMYCKVVEALLKELHTPIYARQLGNETLSRSSKIVFGKLLHADGTVDTSSKDLTIGSFSHHIVKPSTKDESNNIDHPDDFAYEPKMGMIQKITSVKSYTQVINLEWSQHAVNLAVIQGVRNKSAHEARPITKANFDWLIQTLFDEGELLRIAKLADGQYPSG